MGSIQTLSPKPSIDEALAFLGMDGMDEAMGLRALLNICEHDDLPLYFDQQLTCVPTSIQYGDQFDHNNEFVEIVLVSPDDETVFFEKHRLGSFLFWKPSDKSFEILVNKVIHDDAAYFIALPDRTLSEGESIPYEKFYFDRKQLIEFKKAYSAKVLENKVNQREFSRTPGKIEQRITAFKYWLVGSSGKSIHSQDHLQSCYESKSFPTRDQVWSQLQSMDRQLFAHGKDDFLKEMSKVVQFKKGTGKDRNI